MKKSYSIKDIELITGIKAHTIRIWESRYNLIKPQRTDTNIRLYTDEDIKKLLNISVVLQNGMKISHAAKLSDSELLSSVSVIDTYQGSFEGQRKALKVAMMGYDEFSMNNIINSCMIKHGTQETLDELLGPFINEIGLLWQTNAIGVGHEHFVSNVLRMKMFSLLDHISTPHSPTKPGVIFFLPSGELHELGLLYLCYNFKKAGFKTMYLGQDVPLDYVFEASEIFNPEYLVSIFTTQPHFEDLDYYFGRIAELFGSRKMEFLLTGFQLSKLRKKVETPSVQAFESVGDLKNEFLRRW